MNRTIGLSVLAVALLLAWQSYAVWSMLQTCGAKARAIIAAADPLDRDPPQQVRSLIEKNLPFDRILDYLSTALLDRHACRGRPNWSRTDWLIEKPTLAWHLRTTLGKSEVIALYATAADMGKGEFGLSRGARRMYNTEISQLDDNALNCLINKPFGKQIAITLNAEGQPYYYNCPAEVTAPPPIQFHH